MRMPQLSAALLPPITAGMATFSYAHAPTVPEPPAVLTVTTSSIPKADTQEVRILSATLQPGAASTWHTHPSPPFAYVIEGTVVIESETRPPIVVKTGHANRGADGGSHSRRQSWNSAHEARHSLRRPTADTISRGGSTLKGLAACQPLRICAAPVRVLHGRG
jgi:hypothetical protein